MHLPIFSIWPLIGMETLLSWTLMIVCAFFCLSAFYFAGKDTGGTKATDRKWGFGLFAAAIVSALCVWVLLAFAGILVCLYGGRWLFKDIVPSIWAGIRNK